MSRVFNRRRVALRVVFLLLAGAGLAFFYYHAATEHARVINTARARADQSGYLWDAVGIYQMRHGSPDALIGERNRMPVYPWILSWLYDPALSPDDYFARAKAFNIKLSLLLLGVMAVAARRFLTPHAWINFVLVVAFGYFAFKAGYAQVELLYYTLFFLTFLAACLLLRSERTPATLALAATAGVLAALSHLSKAAALPLVGVLSLVLAGRAAAPLLGGARGRRPAMVRAIALAVFVAAFLGVLSPYLLNNKRVFGHYFYNVNTTFYVWYDDWTAASWGVYRHGDGVGWPKLPPDQIPTMRTYLRDHTAQQIAARFWNGFLEMFTVSYNRLGHLKYVTMYILFGIFLIASNRRAFVELMRSRLTLFLFLALYAAVYIVAVSFYQPISGTTLRMLLAHVAPLLFVLSCFFARPPFNAASRAFHVAVTAVIAIDLAFLFWPRLMRDFAGY